MTSKEYYQAHREQELARQKKYREQNKEKIAAHKNEYMKEYYKKNKEAIKKYRHEWYLRNADKRRAQEKQRYIENGEEIRAQAKEYRDSHKEEIKKRNRLRTGNANHILGIAIARGKIKKQPCEVCGLELTEAHHDDYNKPMEVRWLCNRHHHEWHRSNAPIYYKVGK